MEIIGKISIIEKVVSAKATVRMSYNIPPETFIKSSFSERERNIGPALSTVTDRLQTGGIRNDRKAIL